MINYCTIYGDSDERNLYLDMVLFKHLQKKNAEYSTKILKVISGKETAANKVFFSFYVIEDKMLQYI
ncbi:hypothetical protein [Treponema pedis]|uniref:hypothetical protein n=1 Tax=Treponema pedis TaxID=409322 RepID=UPI000465BD6F|nr:hypothetical protein [Treponema pedis]